ncbi:alpha/beta fold hydrolase [Aureimonas mangrovi]|uniref:alpha/beta fold hydrolase n=1 Tax=Aureimonas mangrovi TaxID=2758041 RepID=UPI001AEE937D|nr:alpha/beta fold hydrolase [Aureimonas mangrovi]
MAQHIVFIPGLLCTGDLFRDQTKGLDDFSIANTLSDASIGAMADRLLANAPERFSLVGLSMGGYVAFEVLSRAPERVERLALLDTSARSDREEQKFARRDLVAKGRAEGILPVIRSLLPNLVAESALDDADLVRRVEAMAEDVGVDAFAAQQEAIIGRADMRPRLSSIRVPTLIVVGKADALTPPKVAREMADGIPDAQLEIVKDCGHLSTLEKPEIVDGLLRAFFAGGLTAQFEAGPNV